jgi:hypothetical protein
MVEIHAIADVDHFEGAGQVEDLARADGHSRPPQDAGEQDDIFKEDREIVLRTHLLNWLQILHVLAPLKLRRCRSGSSECRPDT